MKYFALVFFVFVVALGCESGTKKLDWSKTARAQKLQIGDSIIVEGIAYNIFDYEYTKRSVFPNRDRTDMIVRVARQSKKFFGLELFIPVYNPNQPDVETNPDVPIGSVVCTVYNPKLNEEIKKLDEMYPSDVPLESTADAIEQNKRYSGGSPPRDRNLSSYLIIQHKFLLTGTIQGFERRTLRGVSLACVDIEVSDIKVIESQKVHEKLYD